MNPFLTAAFEFIKEGTPVFPVYGWDEDGTCRCGRTDPKTGRCRSGKHPVGSLVPSGVLDATLDPQVALRWWCEAPHFGIAACTSSARWVLDEDVAGAADSLELPPTRSARTPSGGRHFWLAGGHVGNTVRKIPGCDTRGDRGYVVVPPTPGYVWLDRGVVAEAPASLLDVLVQQPAPPPSHEPIVLRAEGGSRFGLAVLRNACTAIEAAPEGQRHNTLRAHARTVGGFVATGEIDLDLAAKCLCAAGRNVQLPDEETQATVAWGLASGREHPLRRPEARR